MSTASGSKGGPDAKPKTYAVGSIAPFDPTPSIAAATSALRADDTDFALIGGLALEAWGLPSATRGADFAVPVDTAERAAVRVATPTTERRPLRIGGVAVRDESRNVHINFIDRRFHLAHSSAAPSTKLEPPAG